MIETYIPKIKEIISKYSEISEELDSIKARIDTLEILRNNSLLKIEQNREAERRLIDKIEKETGESVDFKKILDLIQNENH
jgi:chromosome segregation ATPase